MQRTAMWVKGRKCMVQCVKSREACWRLFDRTSRTISTLACHALQRNVTQPTSLPLVPMPLAESFRSRLSFIFQVLAKKFGRRILGESCTVIRRFRVRPLDSYTWRFSFDSSTENQAHKLWTESGSKHVYCHMTQLPGCGNTTAWTLVMKTDGLEVGD